MTETPTPQPSANDLWDDAFKPYAIEIGFLVREWNGLQEKLCDIFSTVLGVKNGAVARAIWYAVQNDRLQRKLLQEAAKATFEKQPKILDAILWLVDKTDGIGQQRDNAIHSPVSMIITDPREFIALYFYGHPRATTLKGKKLLAEIHLYREKAKILEKYASALEYQIRHQRTRWGDETLPLPEKPSLPSLEQKTQEKVSSHKVRAKERIPPPRSSPA